MKKALICDLDGSRVVSVVLEDAKSGIEAANAGGFLCITRDNHLGQDLANADLIVQDYDDPPAILAYLESS